MTSIRQHEQTSNDNSTERRNENDNTCNLVEEDRTILEPTAQSPACHSSRLDGVLPTNCLTLVGLHMEDKKVLTVLNPSRLAFCFFSRLFFSLCPAATTAGLTFFFFAYTVCLRFRRTESSWKPGKSTCLFQGAKICLELGVEDGKRGRKKRVIIREGVFLEEEFITLLICLSGFSLD